MTIARIEGWESRLYRVIEAARNEPYELGRHDCFKVSCQVIEALTGVDRWPEFAGYRTRREALMRIAEHGSNFEEAGDWFFGGPRIPLAYARRGDIVALAAPHDGDKHLGVCLGNQVAFLSDQGLDLSLKVEKCLCAWKVGA